MPYGSVPFVGHSVWDGPSDQFEHVEEWSGDASSAAAVDIGNWPQPGDSTAGSDSSMFVRFSSDDSVQGSGFSALFTVTDTALLQIFAPFPSV